MIMRGLLCMLWLTIWCLLSWPPTVFQTVIGLVAAVLVTALTADMFEGAVSIPRALTRLPWFVYYIGVFLVECLKANIDVAWRVVHPDTPIHPGTVRVNVSLKSDIALTFLANSITLTPGTTTVDIDREKGILYVHWIDVKGDTAYDYSKIAVVEKFEAILRRIFE